MVRAVRQFDFMPGETLVTGARLEKPEKTIRAAVDSAQLVVTQEQATDENDFFKDCDNLSTLATELFQPARIWSNGFAQKLYWPFSSPEAALKASLGLASDYHNKLAKEFGMSASHKLFPKYCR